MSPGPVVGGRGAREPQEGFQVEKRGPHGLHEFTLGQKGVGASRSLISEIFQEGRACIWLHWSLRFGIKM